MSVFRLLGVLMLAAPAWAGQTLVLDLSMSMAGFARPADNRLPGVLERLAVLLQGNGALEVYGLSGPAGRVLTPYSWKQGAALYSTPKSFHGSTPLSKAIEEAVSGKKATDLIVMTDGMEDSGNLDRLGAALSGLAGRKWGVGLAVVAAPFKGVYYTEQTITDAMLPQIEQSVHARNAAWSVQRADARDCEPGQCYSFTGNRALVFLCLSSSGSPARLLDLVSQSLLESQVTMLGKLHLAPFEPPKLSVTLDAPAATRAHIKLPVEPKRELMCAEPVSERMEMSVHAVSSAPAPQPSILRAGDPQVLEKPGWIAQGPRADSKISGVHHFGLVCLQGRTREPVSVIPGNFRLHYQPILEVVGPGWWDEWSADNSWQFPFKAYKLTALLRAVHAKAIAGYVPAPLDYTLTMRVQN